MINSFAALDRRFPIIIIVLILLIIFVFELAMFVSAIRNRRITGNKKDLWIIGMLLIHPFVAIAYYFTDHKKV